MSGWSIPESDDDASVASSWGAASGSYCASGVCASGVDVLEPALVPAALMCHLPSDEAVQGLVAIDRDLKLGDDHSISSPPTKVRRMAHEQLREPQLDNATVAARVAAFLERRTPQNKSHESVAGTETWAPYCIAGAQHIRDKFGIQPVPMHIEDPLSGTFAPGWIAQAPRISFAFVACVCFRGHAIICSQR